MGAQAAPQQQAGQMVMAHYLSNTGGLNITDSALAIDESMATGGYNYEYVKTGGIKKSRAPSKVNAVADSQLLSRGFGLYNTKAGERTLIRAATLGLEEVSLITGAITPINGTVFDPASEKLAFSAMFTNPASDVLWWAGGGADGLVGVTSTMTVTTNGTAEPTGSITATPATDSGVFLGAGNYYWAVAFRKRSTQALSNAALDVLANIAMTTDQVTIGFTGITNADVVEFDRIYLYRSIVNGNSGFTAGDLVTTVDITTTSYIDNGSFEATSQVVPREGNTLLDNSPLPAGTYDVLTVWKRRLVTASDSTLYFSDINLPESWPLQNSFNIPSGGKITAVVAIGYNHPGGTSIDEFLVVFKENECWLVTGETDETWALQFIDYTGCVQQGLLTTANGFIYWIDRRGAYVWDGVGKPVYMSRMVESLFSTEGDLNRVLLRRGTCDFYRDQNQIVWFLSSNTLGEQNYVLKLDLRLTLPIMKNMLGERVIDGVFVQGLTTAPVYATKAIQSPSATENRDFLITGDNVGFVYKSYNDTIGTGNEVSFSYDTAHLDQGLVGQVKRYNKIIVWVDAVGNFPLTLDYWTDYRVRDVERSSLTVPIGTGIDSESSLWDVGFWDVAFWDSIQTTIRPVVFNLPPGGSQNNNEGDAIKLRFSNANSGQPITINAFTILYTTLGVRK